VFRWDFLLGGEILAVLGGVDHLNGNFKYSDPQKEQFWPGAARPVGVPVE